MTARVGLSFGLLALAVAPAVAADEILDADALRARINTEPFTLTFVDARGRVELGDSLSTFLIGERYPLEGFATRDG